MRQRLIILSVLVTLAALLAVSPADGQEPPGGVVVLSPSGPTEDDSFDGGEVRRTRADTWHFAGHRGAGMTIGLIGFEYGGAAWDDAAHLHEVPPRSQVAAFCRDGGSACDEFTGGPTFTGDRKGVAYAEVVHDMAPAADLAVATVTTTADLEDAIQFFVDEGVDVMVRSTASPYDGPGDGTGPIDAALDGAVDAGMVVVQALGNAGHGSGGGSYFRWNFLNADHDEWVDFNASGDERLTITHCGQFRGLRWNDFGEGVDTTDYDLRFLRPDGSSAGVASIRDQQAGEPPIEWNEPCFFRNLPMDIGVQIQDPGAAVDDDVLELLAEGMTLEDATVNGSADGPGEDSANPGVVTVGALSTVTSGLLSATSSQGPTRDGRTNPDLAAASCLGSYSLDVCFKGTAASAAVVAGAAALYRADHPAATPADVATWLTTAAVVDRGPAGVDNGYGAGELILPSMGPRPHYRPDARIRGAARDGLIGNNVYTRTGARQRATLRGAPGHEVVFTATFENDGTGPERFLLAGSQSTLGFRIRYFVNNVRRFDVTTARHSTRVVQPGDKYTMQVRVRIPDHPLFGGIDAVLQVLSQTNLTQVDAVRFRVLVQ